MKDGKLEVGDYVVLRDDKSGVVGRIDRFIPNGVMVRWSPVDATFHAPWDLIPAPDNEAKDE